MNEILHWDMEAEAERSTEPHRVLWSGQHTQLVLQTVPVGGETGEELYPEHDQLVSFVSNGGNVVIDGEERLVAAGDVVAIPAGTRHNIRNVAPHRLVLCTTYGPPDAGGSRKGEMAAGAGATGR